MSTAAALLPGRRSQSLDFLSKPSRGYHFRGNCSHTLARVSQPCSQNGFGGQGEWRLKLPGRHWRERTRWVPGVTRHQSLPVWAWLCTLPGARASTWSTSSQGEMCPFSPTQSVSASIPRGGCVPPSPDSPTCDMAPSVCAGWPSSCLRSPPPGFPCPVTLTTHLALCSAGRAL